MQRTCEDALKDMLKCVLTQTVVEMPCKIVNINSQYSVDIEYYNHNKAYRLYNVPVKHIQSQKAFVFLGLNVGDYGTLRVLDNYNTGYNTDKPDSVEETRCHNINDSYFSAGFYPMASYYLFPEGDIVIGTNSGATINLTESGISIVGENVVIQGNVVIDGIGFLEHTHISGKEGSPTGGVEV